MKETETRVTSTTGGQKGQKLPRLGGADPKALMELAKVFGFGEEKYARFNYLKGYDWSLSIDALYRHFLAFQAGEDRDEESGLLHMAHVAWHALALTAFQLRDIGSDDRFREEPDLSTMDQMIGLGIRSAAFYRDMLGIEDPGAELRDLSDVITGPGSWRVDLAHGTAERTHERLCENEPPMDRFIKPERVQGAIDLFRHNPGAVLPEDMLEPWCPDHDPNGGPGSDFCYRCRRYPAADTRLPPEDDPSD